MVALGLVLLVLAALLTLGIVFSNTDPANVAAFGVSLSGVSVGGLFLVGVITGLVGMLGLTMFLGGAARQRHKKVAVKRDLRSTRGEADSLAEENARLAAELEAQRAGSVGSTGASASTAPVTTEEHPRRGMFGR